jgi:hypothetical protein
MKHYLFLLIFVTSISACNDSAPPQLNATKPRVASSGDSSTNIETAEVESDHADGIKANPGNAEPEKSTPPTSVGTVAASTPTLDPKPLETEELALNYETVKESFYKTNCKSCHPDK